MSEQVSIEVYPFGTYAGRVPTFVAEMIETLREPASFDDEAQRQLHLDMLPKSTPAEVVGWTLVSHQEATAEQAGLHLDAVWGGQNGDVAAKLPGCPYWLTDLDIPAVRFIETTVGSYPDPAWENGDDPDFWFVEVVDIPNERREHLQSLTEEEFKQEFGTPSAEELAALQAEFEAPLQQIIVATCYKIAGHEVLPMRAARTRTLTDAKYMVRQEIGR